MVFTMTERFNVKVEAGDVLTLEPGQFISYTETPRFSLQPSCMPCNVEDRDNLNDRDCILIVTAFSLLVLFNLTFLALLK